MKFFMFFVVCRFSFQNQPFRKILSGIPIVSNSLDQARRFVGLDQVPNRLQKISADDTRRQS